MKKRTRKVLTIALAILFAVGLAGMAWNFVGYQRGAQDYSDAEELLGLSEVKDAEAEATETAEPENTETDEAVQEEPQTEDAASADPYAKALSEANVAALQEANSEVIGWIQIPNTGLSYPLLQGADNDYYLNYTWQKKRNPVGAIFMDYRNSSDLSDFNTIIYGHNMNNGSMFGHLHQFKNQSFLESHPYVYLLDDEANCRTYRIFAVYEVSVSTAESYRLSFSDQEDKQAFIDDCLALSNVSTGVVPTVEDQILTLSTCTGRGHATRWVVQAVLEQGVN